jgi:dTDP-4-dehydrorhamnose 3,5-epimerase
MGKIITQGITLVPLKIIEGEKGNIYHGVRKEEVSFTSFGEVYFSSVKYKQIKGWKKHTKMTLTLLVIKGKIKFYVYDDKLLSDTYDSIFEFVLSPTKEGYQKLIIEPQFWVAFEGLNKEENVLMNLASISHDPSEAINDPIIDNIIRKPNIL